MIDNQMDLKKYEKIAAAKQKLKEFKNRNLAVDDHSFNAAETDTNKLRATDSTPLNLSDTLKKLNLLSLTEPDIECGQINDQLKLHIQTIGILVAEKTELQSRLNQQVKKSETKQDECNELAGRLKASRQKISDLEKLVNQMETKKLLEKTNGITEHDSNELIINEQIMQIDELKMKLDEKNQEILELVQLVSKLKTQIENFQICKKPSDDNKDHLEAENIELKSQINELNRNIEENRQTIKNEYQAYVDRLQKQVEDLVDQINKLTDEREESFSKIDFLKAELKKKDEKISESFEVKQNETNPKIELLENEIKYFKQQIDILLKDKVNLEQLNESNNKTIFDLNKNLKEFETERDNFNCLIEELHNNKQTLSRITKQNNELKTSLELLQDENLKLKDKIPEIKFYIEQSVQTCNNLDKSEKETQTDNKVEALNQSSNEHFEPSENKKINDDSLNQNLISEFNLEMISFENPSYKEKIIDYLANMKLIEKKFTKVMEENLQIKEKNNELEHIIQQLEFESETIVDYVTMYQIERKKLNEKFKIKEDTINNISSILNIYKLAFIEIKDLINKLLSLEDERQQKTNDNTSEIDKRIHFIMDKIEQIMLDLSKNFVTSSPNEKNYPDYSIRKFNEEKTYNTYDIENNITKFKTETILCSSCYGDLFIV